MIAEDQYLRIGLGDAAFLLPSSASFAIEKRENLVPDDSGLGVVTAWRESASARWPAIHLDQDLQPVSRADWQRAVFLESSPYPVGLIANEVQLLPRSDVTVEPFTPLGAPATQVGHLFSGAWVSSTEVLLVFDPGALAAYLYRLEGKR
ncbi:MAG: hypothetical protein ACYDDO_01970 [Acidiferrobacterales bacterium]